jgi:hypothetical protein
VKKVVWTLNVNGFSPEITALTFPLMRYYARKIGADFCVIAKRKWPDWPVVYEKLQIHELGRENDWNLFFDADTLIHPECLDWTCFLDDETCAHNGSDFANLRFRYDEHFIKDGRNIGTCGWCTIAPRKCINLWEPCELPLSEILDRCRLTLLEMNSGLMDDSHLVDDYVMSRNLARYHFKHANIKEMLPKLGFTADDAGFFWHVYTVPAASKVQQMNECLRRWQVPQRLLNE